MSNSVTRALYRSLLRVTKRFDKYPALKAMITSDEFTAAGLRGLYSPNTGVSLVELVRLNFRHKRDGVELEMGFAALKYLNSLANKNFAMLFENPNLEILAIPPSATPTSSAAASDEAASTITTTTEVMGNTAETKFTKAMSDIRRWFAGERKLLPLAKTPIFSAAPIMLTSPPKGSSNGGGSTEGGVVEEGDEVAKSSGPRITEEEGALVLHTDPALQGTASNVLKKGVVLVAHPLLGDPFPKCVGIVLKTFSNNRASLLILNTPQSVELGKQNFIFPSVFRQEPCYIGGFTTLLQEFPPVPNYVILHPYRDLPNATVIVDHAEDAPVCMSSITDLPFITRYIEQGRAVAADFRIFIGTVEVNKTALERQIEQGLWMPMNVSPGFVHASPKLGRAGLWHGLMKHCGGEFEQLSLLGQLIETAAPASSTTPPHHQPFPGAATTTTPTGQVPHGGGGSTSTD